MCLFFYVFIWYLCIHITKYAGQMRDLLFLGLNSGANWQIEPKTVWERFKSSGVLT